MFRSLTPEFFDTLVIVVIILGLAFAAVRLYADFTRPLPEDRPAPADRQDVQVRPQRDSSTNQGAPPS
ncbi:MAG: hypothetical protein IPK19_02650 [Chloroflexi bacterium]|nr:hypothetical protein [Chloroflexota bacterium]